MSDLLLQRDANISGCRQYRYELSRRWADGPLMVFVMLNPSTADAAVDDPTIRRCMHFARREGLDGINVVNLFAFRTPSPAAMKAASDPIGPDNDAYLARVFLSASAWNVPVVAAWGAHGSFKRRDARVYQIAKGEGVLLHCFGVTKDGAPKHPLYLPNDAPLVGWSPRSATTTAEPNAERGGKDG